MCGVYGEMRRIVGVGGDTSTHFIHFISHTPHTHYITLTTHTSSIHHIFNTHFVTHYPLTTSHNLPTHPYPSYTSITTHPLHPHPIHTYTHHLYIIYSPKLKSLEYVGGRGREQMAGGGRRSCDVGLPVYWLAGELV